MNAKLTGHRETSVVASTAITMQQVSGSPISFPFVYAHHNPQTCVSFYIPSVRERDSADYIADTFETKAKIGRVSKVDVVGKYDDQGRPRFCAFVHLACVYRTTFTDRFLNSVNGRVKGKNVLYHGPRGKGMYWVVLPSTSASTSVDASKGARPPTLDIGDNFGKITPIFDTPSAFYSAQLDGALHEAPSLHCPSFDTQDDYSTQCISGSEEQDMDIQENVVSDAPSVLHMSR